MTQCNGIICSIMSTFAFWAIYLNKNITTKSIHAHWHPWPNEQVIQFWPKDWPVEVFPQANFEDYPTMGKYKNSSLDNK